jgi:hypothetical protein
LALKLSLTWIRIRIQIQTIIADPQHSAQLIIGCHRTEPQAAGVRHSHFPVRQDPAADGQLQGIARNLGPRQEFPRLAPSGPDHGETPPRGTSPVE